jgi:pimeloyl-ACP methyl ester carboxylesterase
MFRAGVLHASADTIRVSDANQRNDAMDRIIFCHGMPGSMAEAALLQGANPTADVTALNLLDGNLHRDFDAITAKSTRQQRHVVGFSIGAMSAIQLAAQRPANVSRLTLISPAAPLSLGDFLSDMAGKPVFELAMRSPALLMPLTRCQGLMARIAPNALIKMLFANCGAAERDLLTDPQFRKVLTQGLQESLAHHPQGYVSHITNYVTDWRGLLPQVTCPVTLWHGTEDTWARPEMSRQLQRAFGANAVLNLVEGKEHYSTITKVSL